MKPHHLYIAGSLQAAWQQKDFDLLYSNLADNVVWYENPFDQPLRSPDAIIGQWQKDLFNQHDISTDIVLADCVEHNGYYRFKASWTDNGGEHFELDGMFQITLNDDGKILEFRQWWSAE